MKILENFRLSRKSLKISFLVKFSKNSDFGQIFENFHFGQNFRKFLVKVSIFDFRVKVSKNFDFGRIFEKRFFLKISILGSNFRKISILGFKIFLKNFDLGQN